MKDLEGAVQACLEEGNVPADDAAARLLLSGGGILAGLLFLLCDESALPLGRVGFALLSLLLRDCPL